MFIDLAQLFAYMFSILKWLFWRRGALIVGLLFGAIIVTVLGLALGVATVYLLGTGTATLLEIETTPLETASIGLLVTLCLSLLAELVK